MNNNILIIFTSLLLILFLTDESKNYIDKSSKKVQADQNIATKLTKIRKPIMNGNTCSNSREYGNVPLSSQELLHHENSGIEISSMKKNDNLEGEDFLERARKVSLIELANIIVMMPLFLTNA